MLYWVQIDDQICLLINSWCELLVLSCCYRGVGTPGEVRVGGGRGITLDQSAKSVLHSSIVHCHTLFFLTNDYRKFSCVAIGPRNQHKGRSTTGKKLPEIPRNYRKLY
jgi:hypothetical protein